MEEEIKRLKLRVASLEAEVDRLWKKAAGADLAEQKIQALARAIEALSYEFLSPEQRERVRAIAGKVAG